MLDSYLANLQKNDFSNLFLAKAPPESARGRISLSPRKIGLGKAGARKQKNLEACRMGSYATSDPDGVFLHFSD